MHDHLKAEIELMGYKAQNVMEDSNVEQDFLIMSRLMRITRTADFSEEELALYKMAAETAVEDARYVMGSRILTPDFSPEELTEYQWSSEHPTGSCRGYRLTDEPTESEVKDWQETLEWLNKLDFAEALRHVKFIERDETPYADDPYVFVGGKHQNRWADVKVQPKSPYEHWRNSQVGPDDTATQVGMCPLGNDPYSLLDHPW